MIGRKSFEATANKPLLNIHEELMRAHPPNTQGEQNAESYVYLYNMNRQLGLK